jgi:hypothetical protein
MILTYILDEQHNAVPCGNTNRWAEWMGKNNRAVAVDHLTEQVWVSTIFLGVDHDFFHEGVPVLFETMVFGGALNHLQERYSTWEQADLGHLAILARVIEVEALERMAK